MTTSDAVAAAGPSLQERYAPANACFGCGPANASGLRIRSFPAGDDAADAEWTPQPHHEAFPGVLNGGIVGALLDCHSNWTAIHHLMRRDGLDVAPSTVTSELSVRYLAPTPTDRPVRIHGRVVEAAGSRVVVGGTITAGGDVTATSRATFVRVRPGHPAYGRW